MRKSFSMANCLVRKTILLFLYWDTGLSEQKITNWNPFSLIHSNMGCRAAKMASAVWSVLEEIEANPKLSSSCQQYPVWME